MYEYMYTMSQTAGLQDKGKDKDPTNKQRTTTWRCIADPPAATMLAHSTLSCRRSKGAVYTRSPVLHAVASEAVFLS